MASSGIDYSDYQSIASKDDEPPHQRGCLFYGCIIAAVLAVLLLLAIGVVTFLLYRWVGTMVEEYTSIAPHLLQTVDMPEKSRAAVRKRFHDFWEAVKERRPTPPLVLTADEINALLEDNPDWKGKVYVIIDGDRVKGEVSIPLSEIPAFGLTRGRYLNGRAEFNVGLEDGEPSITIRSLEVNGKQPSEAFMKGIAGRNLLEQTQFDREATQAMQRLQSVVVRDGKVFITPRENSEPMGSSTGAATLPDDVLAPPDSRPAVPIESGKFP